jgi:hypothetical protein
MRVAVGQINAVRKCAERDGCRLMRRVYRVAADAAALE